MIEPSIAPWLYGLSEPGTSAWLWAACTLLFRARYSVATMLLPGLLAGFALWQRVPGTLYSLLLLRVYEKGERRFERTLHDVFSITVVSLAVAGLGAMGVRLVQQHGEQRLSTCAGAAADVAAGPLDAALVAIDGRQAAANAQQAAAAGAARATPPGWPPGLTAACLLCGLAFPVACVTVAWLEQTFSGTSDARRMVPAAMLRGVLLVAGCAWLISAARRALIGPDDWILPFPPDLFGGEGTAVGTWLLDKVGGVLTWLRAGAGYVDPAGRLYRSHADMALVVMVTGSVYGIALWMAIRAARPSVANASTGIYLLIVIGAAGTVCGGVSFWCDRYGISPPLLAASWAALNYWFFAVDHYYELFTVPPADGMPAPAREPPPLATCLAGRSFPEDPDGRRTMVVATAAGGGIQAAAWAAEVLTGLATTVPHFRDSLGLLSGVSGGSVGCAFYLTGAAHDPATSATLPDDLADEIRERARSSLLEAVSWGVAFPEIVRLLWGRLPRNVLIDRGWALERDLEGRLEKAYGKAATGRAAAPAADIARAPLRMRDLGARIAAGHLPVPLFNSTVVQTGQRVVIAPVRWFPGPPPRDDGVRPLHLIDDTSSPSLPADPRLATAVRLSATFSYASPVARPLPPHAAGDASVAAPDPASGDPPPAAAVQDRLLSVHLCDGGYADNTGVVSAVEACEAILAGLPADGPRPFDRIVFLRIEPFPLDDRAGPARHEGFWKAMVGPVVSLLSARVATQVERADHELERLAAQAQAAHGIEVAWTTIRFGEYEDSDKPARPPLSWALSTAQQNAVVKSWQVWQGRLASHPVVQPTLAHGGVTTSQVALGSMLHVTRAT